MGLVVWRFLPMLILAILMLPVSASDVARATLVASKNRQIMPALNLTDVKGNAWLEKYQQGRVTIVHFWATWCAPCRKELPELKLLSEKYKRRGLRVITVAADSHQAVRDYQAIHPLPAIVLIDQYGGAMRDYRVTGLPASYITDQARRLRYIAVGRVDWSDASVTRRIEELLLKAGDGKRYKGKGNEHS